MPFSHTDSIPTMEYRCVECKTHYPANDIPAAQKEAGRIECLNCGAIFGPTYSGESINNDPSDFSDASRLYAVEINSNLL
jgi:DNA-directed RNA polymerase subunit RPC12/RpoP